LARAAFRLQLDDGQRHLVAEHHRVFASCCGGCADAFRPLRITLMSEKQMPTASWRTSSSSGLAAAAAVD
jgi:mevalonate pyrophosphate decarboxylase